MSISDSSTTSGEAESTTFTPPATQAELNSIISGRLERERAKFADYDELATKAAKLAQIEEANLSEIEKANAAADAAHAEAESFRVQLAERDARDAHNLLAAEVAAGKGVPVDLLHGDTREELEAHADKLVEFGRTRKVDVVPNSGRDGEPISGGLAAGRERARKK